MTAVPSIPYGLGCTRSLFILLVMLLLIVPPTTAAPRWEINATVFVTSVIDGDTFVADPVGSVRLADIDAPEVGELGAEEATAHLSSLVYHKRVYLDVDDLYGRDVYGRVVAVVYAQHNATHLLNVNQELLQAGMVEVTDFPNEFS